jgi:hypothetical protein
MNGGALWNTVSGYGHAWQDIESWRRQHPLGFVSEDGEGLDGGDRGHTGDCLCFGLEGEAFWKCADEGNGG